MATRVTCLLQLSAGKYEAHPSRSSQCSTHTSAAALQAIKQFTTGSSPAAKQAGGGDMMSKVGYLILDAYNTADPRSSEWLSLRLLR